MQSNEESVTEEEITSVIQIWENLPSVNKAVSVASVVLYMFTSVISMITVGIVPWYITIGFLMWPMVVIAWLVVIWALFAIIAIASVLFQGKITASTARSRWVMRIAKTILFVPTVIGSALAVVDVFATEIFQED
jgi:hypothetical protein